MSDRMPSVTVRARGPAKRTTMVGTGDATATAETDDLTIDLDVPVEDADTLFEPVTANRTRVVIEPHDATEFVDERTADDIFPTEAPTVAIDASVDEWTQLGIVVAKHRTGMLSNDDKLAQDVINSLDALREHGDERVVLAMLAYETGDYDVDHPHEDLLDALREPSSGGDGE